MSLAPAGARPWEGFAQYGPLAASVTESGVAVFDLERQTTTEVYATRRHEQVLALDMTEDTVVWMVGKYDQNSERVPCDHSGGLDWRLVAHTISTGAEKEIASGRNVNEIGCGAWPSAAAVDGDLVAYSNEGSDPGSWEIVLKSISSGEIVRTIATGRVVAYLDVDAGAVAYTTGRPPDPSDPYLELDDLRVFLSTQTQPEPRLIQSDEWSISFGGGRMAWATSDTAPAQCLTATLNDPAPVVIADGVGRGTSPQTSGDLVSYVTMTDTTTTGNIWDARTGLTYHVAPELWLEGLYTNGGWLVWTGDTLGATDVWTLQGLPLTEVPGLGQ